MADKHDFITKLETAAKAAYELGHKLPWAMLATECQEQHIASFRAGLEPTAVKAIKEPLE